MDRTDWPDSRIDRLEARINGLPEKVATLTAEMREVRADIAGIRVDVAAIRKAGEQVVERRESNRTAKVVAFATAGLALAGSIVASAVTLVTQL